MTRAEAIRGFTAHFSWIDVPAVADKSQGNKKLHNFEKRKNQKNIDLKRFQASPLPPPSRTLDSTSNGLVVVEFLDFP